jgi:hypothetical protein
MALCSVDDVKTALGIEDTIDDLSINLAVEASTAMIEQYCGRQFSQDATATARIYVATNPYLVHVDDISTTSGLIVKTDPGEDGSFSQTWQTADYQLEPLNAKMSGQTWPYHTIRAIRSLYFPMDYNQALVQITARWGWPSIPNAVKQAAIIQSITVFKSPDAPFGATPFQDTGILRLRSALHPTAAALLTDYRLDPVRVA